jgi:hypothetical protein
MHVLPQKATWDIVPISRMAWVSAAMSFCTKAKRSTRMILLYARSKI